MCTTGSESPIANSWAFSGAKPTASVPEEMGGAVFPEPVTEDLVCVEAPGEGLPGEVECLRTRACGATMQQRGSLPLTLSVSSAIKEEVVRRGEKNTGDHEATLVPMRHTPEVPASSLVRKREGNELTPKRRKDLHLLSQNDPR